MEKILISAALAPKWRVGGFILAAALAGSLAENARAAIVTWGSATTISGDSDVSTTGNLVGAFNVGSFPPDTTVNGVLFKGLSVSGEPSVTSGDFTLQTPTSIFQVGAAGSTSDPFNSLSASYQTLLSTFGGRFTPTAFSLTINNLTIGFTYEFQVWTSASAGTGNTVTTITAGNSVSLSSRIPNSDGAVGQFAIGSFVADSATQVFSFGGPTIISRLNGFQLRMTAVPEPAETTAVVAGLLGLGAFVRQWRRRVA